MSSSRAKRKRNDGDPTAAAATTAPLSRRRSREARSSGAEPILVDAAPANKNEGASHSSNNAAISRTTPAVVANTSTGTATTIGESSASGNPAGPATAPQHAQATAAAAATKQATRETNEEKKRESEPNAVSPPPPGTGNASKIAPAMDSSSETVKRASTPQNLADAATSSAALPSVATTAVPLPSALPTTSTKKKVPTNANNGDSRESKLQAMITHRKVLLERVKSGRSAARSRIVDVARREAQSASKTKQLIAASGGDPSKGNNNTAGLSEKARDEAEVAAFKKLSKSALQAAKKQRAENNNNNNNTDGTSGPGDKRSSVSLRKGASVGKNMKAALSSLIPGGAVSSAVPLAAASFAGQPLHIGAAAGEKTAALLPTQRTTAVPRIPGQLPLPTKKQKSGQIQPHAAATKQPREPGAMAVDSMPKVARTNTQKNMKTASNATMARGISSSAPSASSLPLHAGLSAPGLPSNRLVGPPPVICPEAQVLRDRKKAIRSKLLEHLKEQQKRMTRAEDSGSQSTTTEDSTKSVAAASSSIMSLSLKSGPEQPSHLPSRRKTHWDNLLGEMKWLATDFLEERKWKVSAARTLGSALKTSGAKAMKHRIEEATTASSTASSTTPMEVDTETVPPKHDTDSESKKTKKAPAQSVTSKKAASAVEKKPSKLSDSGLYSKPTTDDTNASRKVARIISNMAHELGCATVEASALSKFDESHKQALDRHISARKGIEQDENDGTTVATTSLGESSKDEDKMNVDKGDSAAETGDANAKTGDVSKDKAGSYQRISKAVDALFENSPNKNSRKGTKRGKTNSSGKGEWGHVSLTSWQQETMEFLEKKWGNSNGPGTILAGPRASGKTVAVCALLWKRRANGPQLLLCSPYRVMHWIHEMKRFEGLQIRSFGFSGGISSPISDGNLAASFKPREVVICEYSSLQRLQQRDFASFDTLVIDCRYPCGFKGSRRPSDFDGKVLEHSINTSIVPADLINESWWEHLAKLRAKSSSSRLLVENPLQASCFTAAPEKTEMQRVELVALRAAFLLGAHIFTSPSSSVKKRILTWARRKTKDSVEPSGNKIKAVQDFLVELVQPLYCPEKGSDNLLELVSHTTGKRFEIETRPCSLSETERREYDKSCVALRGALSFDSSKFPSCKHLRDRSLKTISDALLRLRRQCVHTDLSSIFTSAPMLSRLRSYDVLTSAGTADNRMLCRKVNDSPSQTDTDLASCILRGSAKFRELVSMLRNECYFNVDAHETLRDEFFQPEKGKRGKAKPAIDAKAAKARKKVVILAMLPEVQIILSVLLNCIGIRHELLLRPAKSFSRSTSDVVLSHPEKHTSASTLAWVECQQALARFNTPATPSSTFSTDLIVTSPDIIAGDHGGIGIDMADTVISVDEDWSGRQELIMRSLIAELIPSNLRTKDNGCEFIRLVCEKTCEENFLSIESEETPGQLVKQSNAEAWPWCIDAYGRFDLFDRSVGKGSSKHGSWPWRKQDEEIFAFPASNLLRFRNQTLAEVLSIEDGLPPLLSDGSPVLFLPGAEGEKPESDSSTTVSSCDMDLVVHIMRSEDHTHSLCKEAGVESSAPASLPNNVMTRLDLDAIAIRLYLEHFGGKARVSKQLLSSSNQVVSAGESSSSVHAVSSELQDTVDTNHHVGDAVEFASSLLFYNPRVEDIIGQEKQGEPRIGVAGDLSNASTAVLPVETVTRSTDPPLRVNKYVDAYNLLLNKNIRDGQQGSEAIVYFPPLFPNLQICASTAHRDIEALKARSAGSRTAKRPSDTSVDPVAKRLKLDDPLAPAGFNSTASTAHPVAEAIVHPAVPSLISADEASHSDTATVLLDLDEDFGLIGVGAIPLGKDSAAASSSSIVGVTGNAADPDGAALQNWFDGMTPCDIEELDSFRFSPPNGLSLDSVILFVGRKPRQRLPLAAGNPAYRPPTTLTNALPGPGNGVATLDVNGTGSSAKKSKKKAPANLAVMTPGSHSMSQLPLNVQIAKAKEMYRSRILSFLSARQKALGMTMFESPTYCVAAVRLRNRFRDRLSGQIRASYPSAKNDQTKWTNIVKRLKTPDSATGEYARALAESQLSALRRSLSGPSRVDFGPFHGGFLPAVSGLTGISPPRSRIGISLPMGVKVPSVLQQQHLQHTWSVEDDQRLRECTARYGMNWILVARMLTGFDDIVIASAIVLDENTLPVRSHQQRSARSCRDRWQALARNDLMVAKDARKNKQGIRENKFLYSTSLPAESSSATRLVERKTDQSSSTSFLFPSASLQDKKASAGTEKSAKADIPESSEIDVDEVTGTETDEKPVVDSASKMDVDKQRKKKYGSMMAARSRVQAIPMTIPGVPPGSQASFVASHPSHTQSVQSSIAAAWTNGRTEMWPLQFLDVAEKQRAAKTAASSSPSMSGGSRGSSRARAPGGVPVGNSRSHKSAGQAYASPTRKTPPPYAYHAQAAPNSHIPPSRSPHAQQRMAPSPAIHVQHPAAHPRVSTHPQAAHPVHPTGPPPNYTPVHSQRSAAPPSSSKSPSASPTKKPAPKPA